MLSYRIKFATTLLIPLVRIHVLAKGLLRLFEQRSIPLDHCDQLQPCWSDQFLNLFEHRPVPNRFKLQPCWPGWLRFLLDYLDCIFVFAGRPNRHRWLRIGLKQPSWRLSRPFGLHTLRIRELSRLWWICPGWLRCKLFSSGRNRWLHCTGLCQHVYY